MSNGNQSIQEVKWTDDAIRWQGGLHGDKLSNLQNIEEDSSSGDDNQCMVDPFADPDPTELQTFQFVVPSSIHCSEGASSSTSDEKDKNKQTQTHIEVSIQGYKSEADAVWKSTGLTLWKASHYLCEYQVENPQLFTGNVLELGAGLGLNGILAWKIMCLFAKSAENSVCITDGDTDALIHLRKNIQRNQMNESSNNEPEITCHQLLWGAITSQTFLSQIAQNKKYDTIIASDIIYAPSIVAPLWETVHTLLKKDGVFVMAFARRKVPVSIEMVLESAKGRGFGYELVKEDREEGIWVYLFRFEA
jgi:predicted nicotinamide N-methyase